MDFTNDCRFQVNSNMLMPQTITRTLKERLFSFTPWKRTKIIKVPADYFYVLNKNTIVGHPIAIAQLKIQIKQTNPQYFYNFRESNNLFCNVI